MIVITRNRKPLDHGFGVDAKLAVGSLLKTKPDGRKTESLLMLLILLVLVSSPEVLRAERFGEVYIYCFPEFGSSRPLLDFFSNRSDWRATVWDLKNSSNSDRFQKIVRTLVLQGVQVVPPEICIPCDLAHMTWEEIYLSYASPLVGFVRGGKVVAIAIAVIDHKSLERQCSTDGEVRTEVFTVYEDETVVVTDNDVRVQLGNLLISEQYGPAYSGVQIIQLLPLILTAALVDAVNPCEFYVLVAFLSLVFFRTGRKAALKAGVAYSVAVFVVYYLMGVGLIRLITLVQEVRLFVVILGLSVGSRTVLSVLFSIFGFSVGLRDTVAAFLNRRLKRVPVFLSSRLHDWLRKISENPTTAFAFGFATSVLLLPCTSGPYLIAVSLIADLEMVVEGLMLLAVYNAVIVAPFLVITLGIYMLRLKTSELKSWSSQRQRLLNLGVGLLMIFLSLYLLLATVRT